MKVFVCIGKPDTCNWHPNHQRSLLPDSDKLENLEISPDHVKAVLSDYDVSRWNNFLMLVQL